MELPIECKNRISLLYDNKGEGIILELQKLIDKIIDKYNLTSVSIYKNVTYNIIISAYNNKWKNIIVKIGIKKREIRREINFYNKYKNNSNICKIHVIDKKNGYIIMENIVPGTKLNSLKTLRERLKVFEEIYNKIDCKKEFLSNLPRYKSILYKKFNSIKEKELERYIIIAKRLYNEIEMLNLPKYILHGDLHHWNIIKSEKKWIFIDPVGFLGEKIFDLPVFLQNEFWKYGENEENIKGTIEYTSKQLNIEKNIIYKSLYINLTLTVMWNIEDNDSKTLIKRNINILNILEKYI